MKKNSLILIIIIFLVSCKKDTKIDNSIISSNKILREQIDGPANIRDSINGNILFSLNDKVNVDVVGYKNDWFIIYVFVDSINVLNNRIKNSDSIFQNNKVAGISLTNNTVFEYYSGSNVIEGYTHKNNIKEKTLIESVIVSNLAKRDLKDWNSIIKKFDFEIRDDILDYNAFQLYENNDISPGWRVLLLFEDNKLVGFLHTRKIQSSLLKTNKLEGFKDYKLSFYKDYNTEKSIRFSNYINKWLGGVD